MVYTSLDTRVVLALVTHLPPRVELSPARTHAVTPPAQPCATGRQQPPSPGQRCRRLHKVTCHNTVRAPSSVCWACRTAYYALTANTQVSIDKRTGFGRVLERACTFESALLTPYLNMHTNPSLSPHPSSRPNPRPSFRPSQRPIPLPVQNPPSRCQHFLHKQRSQHVKNSQPSMNMCMCNAA